MSDWSRVKQEMVEVLDIVKMCPEPLQERCFELLTTALLQEGVPRVKTDAPRQDEKDSAGSVESTDPVGTDEISETDLHLKVRRLLSKEGVSLAQVNALYYKEDDSIKPLYDTLGTHKMAEAQIRLALLAAFEHALPNGDFCFAVEDVRSRCSDMKCYDSANFAANFKKSASLFDNFAYKSGATGELSAEGKKELAAAIKALAAE